MAGMRSEPKHGRARSCLKVSSVKCAATLCRGSAGTVHRHVCATGWAGPGDGHPAPQFWLVYTRSARFCGSTDNTCVVCANLTACSFSQLLVTLIAELSLVLAQIEIGLPWCKCGDGKNRARDPGDRA